VSKNILALLFLWWFIGSFVDCFLYLWDYNRRMKSWLFLLVRQDVICSLLCLNLLKFRASWVTQSKWLFGNHGLNVFNMVFYLIVGYLGCFETSNYHSGCDKWWLGGNFEHVHCHTTYVMTSRMIQADCPIVLSLMIGFRLHHNPYHHHHHHHHHLHLYPLPHWSSHSWPVLKGQAGPPHMVCLSVLKCWQQRLMKKRKMKIRHCASSLGNSSGCWRNWDMENLER
jgi:hypothetical protein